MKNLWSMLIIVILGSCMNGSREQERKNVENPWQRIDSLQWLFASWQMKTPDGILYEQWSRKNDSVFRGAGYLVSGTDTLFQEQINLEQHGGDLFYVPSVSNQNGGKPVTFKLVSASRGTWVFENPAHDFPQQIIYSHPHADSLVAVVAGKENGKERREVFRFGK